MDIEVGDEVVLTAKECRKGHACLAEPGCVCEVDYCAGGDVLFVKCQDVEQCPYKCSFGHGNICLCPVRKARYKKHKV
jgi:hypothetical protein